jgi:hypothetical protein
MLIFSIQDQGELFQSPFQYWRVYKDGISAGKQLYDRHYSARHYKDGRKKVLWHWVLEDPKPCRPVPAKGSLGLWEYTGEIKPLKQEQEG